MFWAASTSALDGADLLAGAARVHAVEGGWLERIRSAEVVAYRLSRESVEPLELVGLGESPELYAAAGIELRIVSNLWPL